MKLYHKISYNKREILTDLKGLGQAFLGFDEKRRVSNKHFLHLCILKIAYFFVLYGNFVFIFVRTVESVVISSWALQSILFYLIYM